MKISAGLILTDGYHLLIGHVTGQTHWDIPKGGIEPGEMPIDACIREVKEETGLDIDASRLIDMGEFDYMPTKKLHLFLMLVDTDELPDINSMKCTHTFIDCCGDEIPEMDDYWYLCFHKARDYCTKNMRRVLNYIDENFVELAGL